MRLEPLCEMTLAYRVDEGIGSKFVLVRPFDGEEGAGFGGGDGTVTGEKLSGRVRWTNYPHRRSDGSMIPNVSGVITTDDGAQIVFTLLGGRAHFEGAQADQLLLVTFIAEDERYRWLNDAFCVLEGVYYAQSMDMIMRIYECINEMFESGSA